MPSPVWFKIVVAAIHSRLLILFFSPQLRRFTPQVLYRFLALWFSYVFDFELTVNYLGYSKLWNWHLTKIRRFFCFNFGISQFEQSRIRVVKKTGRNWKRGPVEAATRPIVEALVKRRVWLPSKAMQPPVICLQPTPLAPIQYWGFDFEWKEKA